MRVTTIIFFGALWLLLASHIFISASTDVDALNEWLEANGRRQLQENNEALNPLEERLGFKSSRERTLPYYERGKAIIDSMNALQLQFDQWKDELNNASLLKARRIIFAKGRGETIAATINRMLNFYLDKIEYPDFRTERLKEYPFSFIVKTAAFRRKQWIQEAFGINSSAQSVAALSALQNDMLFAAQLALGEIVREGMPGCILYFDAIAAISVPNNTFAFPGDPITGTILFGEYNTTDIVDIQSNQGIVKIEKGVGVLTLKSSGFGWKRVSGTITAKRGAANITKPWSFVYFTGYPFAFIHSPHNIFYRGVANAVTLEPNTYSKIDLTLQIAHASVIHKAPGRYNVMVDNTAPSKLLAYVVRNNVVRDTIAVQELRIKDLPLPVVKIAAKDAADLTLADFNTTPLLTAVQADDDINATYRITGFNIELISKEEGVATGPFNLAGNRFDASMEAKTLISEAKRGDHVSFTDITAIGPDGRKILLRPVSVRLQ